MNYILSTRNFKEEYIKRINSFSKDWKFILFDTLPKDFNWQLVKVTIGWKNEWAPFLLSNVSQLKWVQSISAGVDTLPLSEFKEKGIFVSNGSGIHCQSISDHVLGTMLMKTRGLYDSSKKQADQEWGIPHTTYQNLSEAQVLLAGTGQIGQEIARKLKFFGATTIGLNTNGRKIEFFDENFPLSKMYDEVSKADFFINSLPLTMDTKNVYNEQFFKQMKSTASFINIGRGPSVDEMALSQALKNQQLAFATIDVTEEEPLPKGHFLWKTPNLFITPHISGMTPHFQKLFMTIFITNFESFLQSNTLVKNEVNLTSGY